MEPYAIALIGFVVLLIIGTIIRVIVWLILRKNKTVVETPPETTLPPETTPPGPVGGSCSTYNTNIFQSCSTITIGGYSFSNLTFRDKSVNNNLEQGMRVNAIGGTTHWNNQEEPFFTLIDNRLTVGYGPSGRYMSVNNNGTTSSGVIFTSYNEGSKQNIIYDGRNLISFNSIESTTIFIITPYVNNLDVAGVPILVTDYINSTVSYINIS
jgi:hypothetical protein